MKSLSIIFVSALFLAASGAFAQGAAPAGKPAAAGPTDAQIAHMLVTANEVDIEAGKLAEAKGQAKDVKEFGKQMVTDHTGVNKELVALVTKLKVKPEHNPTSESVKFGGAQNMKKLEGLKGTAFDRAYIDHEVTYHRDVVDAIDKSLIPNAKNAELKALLVKVRPVFAGHLEHAKKIQASLKG